MSISHREEKIAKIAQIISDKKIVKGFASQFGDSPGLHFYRKLLDARHRAKHVQGFLNDCPNLELCYSVLGLWGMDSRGARLKNFDDFCNAVEKARGILFEMEEAFAKPDQKPIESLVGELYDTLDVMQNKGRLIANAKLGHFLFPNWLMPAGGENTQRFLYEYRDAHGNVERNKDGSVKYSNSDSKKRYGEIAQFCFDVRSRLQSNINPACR